MAPSLAGKVAIITGAAGGIGRAYAHHLAFLGADIAIVDKDLAIGRRRGEIAAGTVADEIRAMGRRALEIEGDLAQRSVAENAVAQTIAHLGRLDILVNNAGGAITPIERSLGSLSTDADIELLLGANLLSAIHCCQAAIPVLNVPGGVIVNIATAAALVAVAEGRLAIYGAAKAALLHYTRALAVELGPRGIRANCIAPGIIASARIAQQAQERGIGTASQASFVPLRRLGAARDLVGTLEFLVTDMSAYVTGECIAVTGGATLAGPV